MLLNQYVGGIEHAVMHLSYTRYWNRVMRDFGLVKFDEPVARLLRSHLSADADVTDDDLRRAALADRKMIAAITGKDVKKVIVVPRKLVNIVTE